MGQDPRNRLLRQLPSVDAVLARPDVQALLQDQPRALITAGTRRAVAERRAALLAGRSERTEIDAADVQRAVERWTRPTLRPVINATGVLLHTNLGRAPLSARAIERLAEVCSSYSNLELNLHTGRRGSRMDVVRELLLERTGAEAGLVVNNNAAAVYLILRTLAAGREVLVSRGELVEIGGSFRIPDVMAASGAVLREVGTTNRTRLSDYQRAIGPETALILKVHRSNFEIVGFTEEASLGQLAQLAGQQRLPLVMDMGSATLLDSPPPAVQPYSVAGVLAEGPDLVCFSGDKLLGGPQAGIILGATGLIDRLAHDPMARALRVDKLTLAALEATLDAYRGGDAGARRVPVIGMLLAEPETLRARAERLLQGIRRRSPDLALELVESRAQVGGGSLPLEELASFAVAVQPARGGVDELAERLRGGRPAVLGRLQQDRLLLDVRTLHGDGQIEQVADALTRAVEATGPVATRGGEAADE